MLSPLRQLVLARGMGNTCGTDGFLKQVDFPGSFLKGSPSAAPHPPVNDSKGINIASSTVRGADAFCRPLPRGIAPDQSGRGISAWTPPPRRRARGTRTRQGGTDQTRRLLALVDTVQRAQRPFPDLPEGCGRTSAFPGLAPAQRRRAACHGGGCTPRPHPLTALQPLGDWEPAAFRGQRAVSSHCIGQINEPSHQPAVSRCFLTAERRAKPPQALQSSASSQLLRQATIFG